MGEFLFLESTGDAELSAPAGKMALMSDLRPHLRTMGNTTSTKGRDAAYAHPGNLLQDTIT
jgi:hypothetical protein